MGKVKMYLNKIGLINLCRKIHLRLFSRKKTIDLSLYSPIDLHIISQHAYAGSRLFAPDQKKESQEEAPPKPLDEHKY